MITTKEIGAEKQIAQNVDLEVSNGLILNRNNEMIKNSKTKNTSNKNLL